MRLTRVRFTIRLMMIVVAGAGVVLGASVELHRRHDRFLRLAEHHEASCSITRACGKTRYSATNALGEDVRRWSRRRIEWHSTLAEKYRLAANLPWMPVEADPPEPK